MRRFQFSLLGALAVISLVAAGLGTTIWLFPSEAARARRRAHEDWSHGRAVLYIPREEGYREFRRGKFNEFCIYYDYDRTTGLFMKNTPPWGAAYYDAYNTRVRELFEKFGPPPWSKKGRIPTDDQLISGFDESCMRRIECFPFEVTRGLVIDVDPRSPSRLYRRPTFALEDKSQPQPRDDDQHALRIRWIRNGKTECRLYWKDVYFRRLDHPAGVTLIRRGDLVEAYDHDGTPVASIRRHRKTTVGSNTP